MLDWAKDHGVDWHYIAPGRPMQNGSLAPDLVRTISIKNPTGFTQWDFHHLLAACMLAAVNQSSAVDLPQP
jgi:hypothetical protein